MKSTIGKTLVRYGFGKTRQGSVFVAATERGVCMVQFIEPTAVAVVLQEASRLFPNAELIEDARAIRPIFRQIEAALAGRAEEVVALDLRGTTFQQKVWATLQKVPRGQTASYTELAERAGSPRAVRAVASACARNPVSIFVPCHRIVRRDGGLGGYRWGVERKQALLRREQATR